MSETWLVGGQLVDGTGCDPVVGVDVAICDGRIVALGRAPSGAQVIDAEGLTLTPGLIDAHVHLGLSSDIGKSIRRDLSVAEIAADIFRTCSTTLDEGFTTVRDTGGVDGGLAGVLATGKVRGPRLIPSGPIQCQTGGHGHYAPEWEPTADWCTRGIPGLQDLSLLSDGPDEVRRNVREAFRRGARFIKMCVTGGVVSTHDDLSDTQFTHDEIAAAVDEARARGTYVTVHAHNNDGIRTAVRAGVKCVEHGSQIDEETAALMARAEVAHVPTLAVVEVLIGSMSSGLPPEICARAELVRVGQQQAVLASRAAGVRLGLGSDLIGPDQSQRGRELLLRAELESPMLALQSATAVNAEILGLAADIGTIEVGKAADIVMWAGDPLTEPKVFADAAQAMVILQAGRVVKDLR
jgi:imidazolonepropionase-like amidohydrolase